MNPYLSVIIPAYNEEESVVTVIHNVKRVLAEKGVSFELIVVNDGSTDNTKSVVEKEANVILINHQYKKGYGRALKSGIAKAQGEFILILDGDDQHYPEDILRLLEHTENYDMVIGARTNINSIPRALAKKILVTFANYLAEYKIPDLNSGFRVIKRELLLKYLHLLPDSFSFSSTITIAFIQDRQNLKFIPIKEKPRKAGKSTISPFKDFLRFPMLFLRLTMLFSPFRIFLPASILLFLGGFGYTIYSIVKFLNVPDSGIFLILGSLIIFFFGLLADQIAYIRRKIK